MIDWKQVKQLEEDIGAEDFQDVAEMFLDEVDEAVDSLRCNPDLNANALASALHFLKGSAANLGFQDFGECCSQGEKNAEKGQVELVDLGHLVSLYDQSKKAFLENASAYTTLRL